MESKSKKLLIIGITIALGLVFTFSTGGEAKERVFIIGDYSPVNNLDPAASLISQNIMFYRNIFQGLLRFKFNSIELEGDLAKSWTISDDGLVYTFKLRDNVQFHKGFGKVTAAEVKFSWDRIMDPKTRSVFRNETASVKEVKVIDEHTVQIILKKPDAVFLMKCARPRPVAIVSPKAVEKFGKDFSRNPIGSGPFVFESMSREQIVVTANKDYWEGPAKVDKVIYKTVPDMDTLIMSLEKGDVNTQQALPRDKAVLDRLRAAGVKLKVLNRGAWHFLQINPRVKPLGDLRIRKAIAYAINRDEIIEYVLSGMAEKLNSLVPKGYFGYTEEGIPHYEYDPEKAKKLMAEAGYPDGFETQIDTHNSPSYLPIATAMQAQLAKVGIKCKLSVTDQPSWMKKVTSGTAVLSIYLPVRIPDADVPLTNFFHSAGFTPGPNLARYNKLDKEIDAARAELNPEKRKKLYYQIQKKLMEDLPGIPLFMMNYPTPHRPDVWTGLPDQDPVWGFDFYHFQFVGN
jgi:peptide/nickel transport system substrate-binding protein